MWKPLDVVPEHRTRATVVWGALLLAIVGYTALQIVAIHSQFENPSTNFSVSDEKYPFPPLEICFWKEMGCDQKFSPEECVENVSAAVHYLRGEYYADIAFESQWSNCLGFNLADLDLQGSENQDIGGERPTRPSTVVTMFWDIDPSNQESYRDVVGVFLGDDSTAQRIQVPYSRVVQSPGSASFIETGMTIGKNIRTVISGDYETSYQVLTISTGNYIDPTMFSNTTSDDISQSPRGHLHLTITQGAFSLTELSDINPLDISTLLGNIGGFWEILLVTWGLCFIASRSESPTQRGRDFTHPIRKGKEIIRRKRRSSTQTIVSESDCGGGEEPYWMAGEKGRTDFSDIRSTRVTPSVGEHQRLERAASFFRRPIGHDYPMRPGSSFTRSVDTGERSVERSGSCVDNQMPLAV